jgi:hypothetical protein
MLYSLQSMVKCFPSRADSSTYAGVMLKCCKIFMEIINTTHGNLCKYTPKSIIEHQLH